MIVGGYEQNGRTKRAALYGPPPPTPASLHITPATASMKLGGTRQLTLIDDLGHTRYEATWTVSDPSIATLSTDSLPILTGLAYGQVSVTATINGISAQAQISVGPSSLQITPAVVTMQAGDTRQFTVVDDAGNPTSLATWTLSDSSLATITTDASPMLTAIAPGQITLTASFGSLSGQAQITILPAGQLAPGTVLWTVPSMSGFSALQLAQAVPTDSGPDLYSTQLSNDGTHTTLQALSSDGQQIWQASLPRINGNSVPDSSGGLIVTENNTCLPGQQDPMAIVDLDAKTGQRLWQITAQPSGTLYCFPEALQMAIRGDGSVVIATPGNTSGLPELMLVDGTYGFQTQIPIPPSTYTNPDGTTFQGYSRIGSPIVNSDGSAYVEYEVRQIAYPPTVTSSTLYLLQIAPDNSTSTTQLSSTTSDTSLLPARIIPDGQGGVVATWAISPSNPPVPAHPYQAAHVVAGTVATTYDLPFSPATVNYGQYPTLILGENVTAFATDGTDTANGPKVVSFDLTTGMVNWSYQDAPQSKLSLIVSIAGGGLVAKITNGTETIVRLAAGGTPTYDSLLTNVLSPTLSLAPSSGSNITNIQYSWTSDWEGMINSGPAGFANASIDVAQGPYQMPGGSPSAIQAAVPTLGSIYRNKIAALAKGYVGNSTKWKEGFPHPAVTCNIFVNEVLTQASDDTSLQIPAPTRPPRKRFGITRIDAFLAADWANPTRTAGCWKTVLVGHPDSALPGDVLATGFPANGPDGTGHVGIVVEADSSAPNMRLTSAADVPPYWWTPAQKQSFTPGTITLTDYGFRIPGFDSNDPNNNQGLKPDTIVKRFLCY